MVADVEEIMYELEQEPDKVDDARFLKLIDQLVVFLESLDFYRTDGEPGYHMVLGRTPKEVLVAIGRAMKASAPVPEPDPGATITDRFVSRMTSWVLGPGDPSCVPIVNAIKAALARIEQREKKKAEREVAVTLPPPPLSSSSSSSGVLVL